MKWYAVVVLVLFILTVVGISMLRPTSASAAGGLYASTAHKSGVRRLADEPVGDCTHCHYAHASYDGQHIDGRPGVQKRGRRPEPCPHTMDTGKQRQHRAGANGEDGSGY